jgi:hypothetical protein
MAKGGASEMLNPVLVARVRMERIAVEGAQP